MNSHPDFKLSLSNKFCAALGLVALAGVSVASAQVSYSVVEAVVAENFNDDNFNQFTSNTFVTWVNNTTVPNWHASGGSLPATNNLKYAFGGGAGDTNVLYGYKFDANGNTTAPAGALGMRTSGSGQAINIGWALVNNTGQTLSDFDISYQAFVARGGSAPGTPLTFDFKVGGGFTDTGYTSVSGASTTLNVGGAIPNGTAGNPAGGLQSVSATSVGVTWAAGETLWLRWTAGTAGNDSIGIDNISFAASAIPEPSAFAALAGLGVLGLAASRRRRR